MVITITSLRLRSLFGYFPLTFAAMGIVRQIRKQPGFIAMKNTGFGYLHFTLSSWENAEAAKAFARSGAHQAAMPGWAEAKRLVFEKGRVIAY